MGNLYSCVFNEDIFNIENDGSKGIPHHHQETDSCESQSSKNFSCGFVVNDGSFYEHENGIVWVANDSYRTAYELYASDGHLIVATGEKFNTAKEVVWSISNFVLSQSYCGYYLSPLSDIQDSSCPSSSISSNHFQLTYLGGHIQKNVSMNDFDKDYSMKIVSVGVDFSGSIMFIRGRFSNISDKIVLFKPPPLLINSDMNKTGRFVLTKEIIYLHEYKKSPLYKIVPFCGKKYGWEGKKTDPKDKISPDDDFEYEENYRNYSKSLNQSLQDSRNAKRKKNVVTVTENDTMTIEKLFSLSDEEYVENIEKVLKKGVRKRIGDSSRFCSDQNNCRSGSSLRIKNRKRRKGRKKRKLLLYKRRIKKYNRRFLHFSRIDSKKSKMKGKSSLEGGEIRKKLEIDETMEMKSERKGDREDNISVCGVNINEKEWDDVLLGFENLKSIEDGELSIVGSQKNCDNRCSWEMIDGLPCNCQMCCICEEYGENFGVWNCCEYLSEFCGCNCEISFSFFEYNNQIFKLSYWCTGKITCNQIGTIEKNPGPKRRKNENDKKLEKEELEVIDELVEEFNKKKKWLTEGLSRYEVLKIVMFVVLSGKGLDEISDSELQHYKKQVIGVTRNAKENSLHHIHSNERKRKVCNGFRIVRCYDSEIFGLKEEQISKFKKVNMEYLTNDGKYIAYGSFDKKGSYVADKTGGYWITCYGCNGAYEDRKNLYSCVTCRKFEKSIYRKFRNEILGLIYRDEGIKMISGSKRNHFHAKKLRIRIMNRWKMNELLEMGYDEYLRTKKTLSLQLKNEKGRKIWTVSINNKNSAGRKKSERNSNDKESDLVKKEEDRDLAEVNSLLSTLYVALVSKYSQISVDKAMSKFGTFGSPRLRSTRDFLLFKLIVDFRVSQWKRAHKNYPKEIPSFETLNNDYNVLIGNLKDKKLLFQMNGTGCIIQWKDLLIYNLTKDKLFVLCAHALRSYASFLERLSSNPQEIAVEILKKLQARKVYVLDGTLYITTLLIFGSDATVNDLSLALLFKMFTQTDIGILSFLDVPNPLYFFENMVYYINMGETTFDQLYRYREAIQEMIETVRKLRFFPKFENFELDFLKLYLSREDREFKNVCVLFDAIHLCDLKGGKELMNGPVELEKILKYIDEMNQLSIANEKKMSDERSVGDDLIGEERIEITP